MTMAWLREYREKDSSPNHLDCGVCCIYSDKLKLKINNQSINN